MHVARRLADPLAEPGEEGDHVMTRLALDRLDPLERRGAELGDAGRALLADLARRFLGDGAELGHRLGGERLDFKPDGKAPFRRPDGRHLGSGIARHHRLTASPRPRLGVPR